MEMIQPLLALLLVFFRTSGAPAELTELSVTVALGGLALYLAAGWFTTRRMAEAHLESGQAGPPVMAPSLGVLHFLLFAALVMLSPWPLLAVWLTRGLPFLGALVGFAPYVAHRVLWCLAIWPAERVAPGRRWTRSEFIVFHLRVLALPVIPIVLLAGLMETLGRSAENVPVVALFSELLIPAASLLLLVVVFAVAPILVRWILGARPLAAGPLRQRLEEYGRRNAFKPSDILVWRTGRTVTNALFIGIVPRIRYVVLTDALIDRLQEPEVEAVYAHEAGHGMRRHTQLYVVMAAALLLLSNAAALELSGLGDRLIATGVLPPELGTLIGVGMQVVASVGFLVVFFVVGFGWLSRRFETEADLWAIRTISEPGWFTSALESVGLHMGMIRRGGGMRHFGIGTRIGLINRYLGEPEFRRSFDRLLRRCRLGIVAFCMAGAIWLGVQAPGRIALGEGQAATAEARQAEAEREPQMAEEAWKRAVQEFRQAQEHGRVAVQATMQEVASLAALGDVLLKRGRYEEVRDVFRTMQERVQEFDLIGGFNTENLKVILEAVEGHPDAEAARSLVKRLDELRSSLLGGGWNESVALTYSDLYLVLRAAGAEDPPPGRPGAYSAAARLLVARERAPDASPDQDLLQEARRDLGQAAYRALLLHLAAPELAEAVERQP